MKLLLLRDVRCVSRPGQNWRGELEVGVGLGLRLR